MKLKLGHVEKPLREALDALHSDAAPRERLHRAWVKLAPLAVEELPTAAQGEFRELRSRLTRIVKLGGEDIGAVRRTLDTLSDGEVAGLVQQLHNHLTSALHACEKGPRKA